MRSPGPGPARPSPAPEDNTTVERGREKGEEPKPRKEGGVHKIFALFFPPPPLPRLGGREREREGDA